MRIKESGAEIAISVDDGREKISARELVNGQGNRVLGSGQKLGKMNGKVAAGGGVADEIDFLHGRRRLEQIQHRVVLRKDFIGKLLEKLTFLCKLNAAGRPVVKRSPPDPLPWISQWRKALSAQ